MAYIHEQAAWPNFTWSSRALADKLAALRHRQGRLLGRMEGLGFDLRAEAFLRTLTEDVVKSSDIEGEHVDGNAVRSSIARRLGIDIGALAPTDRHVEGIVEMTLDAIHNYAKPLTAERLFDWHAALFPTGRSGITRITVGDWRNEAAGPMQVVSGAYGRERVHFEAPAAGRLANEMAAFLTWMDNPDGTDPVLRAAIAHLWFVTIHPFEDGNGRIARAIADMMLARSEDSPQRFFSMSAQIRLERDGYYGTLERTQRGGLDITDWLTWFLTCMDRAISGADTMLESVLTKARLWEQLRGLPLNDRQRLIINRLIDGFEGKLTSGKWARIAKVSTDTALRDITELLELGVLRRDEAGGRSTSYSLANEPTGVGGGRTASQS